MKTKPTELSSVLLKIFKKWKHEIDQATKTQSTVCYKFKFKKSSIIELQKTFLLLRQIWTQHKKNFKKKTQSEHQRV